MANPKVQVIQGDITTLEVDAIVTAANESLFGVVVWRWWYGWHLRPQHQSPES